MKKRERTQKYFKIKQEQQKKTQQQFMINK